MTLTVGTDSGVWSVSGERAELIGLDGKKISHVAVRDGTVLAAVPRDGLYSVSGDLEQRIWQGVRLWARGWSGCWRSGRC